MHQQLADAGQAVRHVARLVYERLNWHPPAILEGAKTARPQLVSRPMVGQPLRRWVFEGYGLPTTANPTRCGACTLCRDPVAQLASQGTARSPVLNRGCWQGPWRGASTALPPSGPAHVPGPRCRSPHCRPQRLATAMVTVLLGALLEGMALPPARTTSVSLPPPRGRKGFARCWCTSTRYPRRGSLRGPTKLTCP